MNLQNLNFTELSKAELLDINGGAHVPASDWGYFKTGVGRIAHEVGDFFRGVWAGLN